MLKYELLPEQLIREGTCDADNFFEPGLPDREWILEVHCRDYVNRLLSQELAPSDIRKIGFPLSPQLTHREQLIAQGSILATEFALEHGIAMNIAGGTHHAFSDRGEAFCLLNDQAIAAAYLLKKGKARSILIVDLDVHQGNGTAEIFRNTPEVFTMSIHGKANYPFHKEESDLDIALEKGTGDGLYLSILKKELPRILDRVAPDFVFYLCGVDVIHTDKLGTLGLTLEGCKERDRFVLGLCHEKAIPVQCSMGGGYSPDIRTIIEAHANTFRLAQELYF